MARISEYNVSFQTEVQILRRNVLHVRESKTKRPPFFLPQMKLNEISTKREECQNPDIELDVRGLGGKPDGSGFSTKGKRKEKRARKRKITVNGCSSLSNKTVDHKSPGFSLPPIDSKSLTHHHTENIIPGCSNTTTILPHKEFELAFNTLMSVIERSKDEQKRTTERFQRNIVQGEHKPINDKLQSPEEAKDGCLPDE